MPLVLEVGQHLSLDSVSLSINVPVSQSVQFDRRDEDGEGWPQDEYVGLWQV